MVDFYLAFFGISYSFFFFIPTLFVGFMTATEKELFSAVPANEFNTYWVPCTWFVYRLQEATKKGKLLNQYSLENIMRVLGKHNFFCIVVEPLWSGHPPPLSGSYFFNKISYWFD